MKKLSLILLLFLSTTAGYSQIVDAKINVAAAAVAIVNPSLEVGFAKKSAITMDYMGAFAKESWMGTGYPLAMSMGLFGYRFYTTKKNSHTGFFVGGDFGLNTYRMNKNVIPLIVHDHGKDGYDVGYGYILGATFGYKHRFNNRLGIEASASLGYQYCLHEGYRGNQKLYDLNPSAEWTPYKAGIYLTYRIGE